MASDPSDHRFLRYTSPAPGRRVVREIAGELMNFFMGKERSRSRWQKVHAAIVRCYEDRNDTNGVPVRRNWDSIPFRIGDLERQLEQGRFDHIKFQLFAPQSRWLDEGIDFSTNLHFTDAAGDTLKIQMPLTGLGPAFPIVPRLDREGWVVSSFQRISHSRILRLHRAIVERSHEFTGIEWLDDVRAYICECISLIDMMLHQLYLKAEHAPEPGWRFDVEKLGERHGRRVADKLRWVGQITGLPLDDARDELLAFNALRAVRNHVQHFDPPSFVCSLERDVVGWLDACSSVARLAWKIRRRIGAPPTEELIALLLLPQVEFIPLYADARRSPPGADSGYASSSWPSAVQDSEE